MIFSGHTRGFKCARCGFECSDTSPTSLLPMLAVVGFGTSQWVRILVRLEWNPYATWIAGLVLAVLLPYFLYQLLELVSKLLLRGCAKCGGPLEPTYSGFYDGCLPHPAEVLIYVISVITPYLIWRLT